MKLLDNIDSLISYASRIQEPGARIAFISFRFLGTPYRANTLIGGADTPEVLVINLSELDCFTFLDYIEAIRLSSSYAEFVENLKRVRYRGGEVSFGARNHFFTDWVESNRGLAEDVTERVGGGAAMRIVKTLNLGEEGSFFIPGVPSKEREIRYIPSEDLDPAILSRLRTGDYAGIYTSKAGLDVTHVGIVIRDKGNVLFRHASRDKGRVVDEELLSYIKNKPGLVVLRPLPLTPLEVINTPPEVPEEEQAGD